MRRILLASVVAALAMSLISANPASALTGFRFSALKVADPNTAPGGQPQLLQVTTGHHATFDRVVFRFSSRAPGYNVRYVSQPTNDGSGNPVALAGNRFLAVTMHTVASAQAGKPPAPQGRQSPRYPQLRALVGTGDFEGYVSYTLGLKSKSGFRAFTLRNPDRLVVDVRIPAAAQSSTPAVSSAGSGQLAATGADTGRIALAGVALLLLGWAAWMAAFALRRRND